MADEKNKFENNKIIDQEGNDENQKKVKYQVVSDKALNWILEAKENAFEEATKSDGSIDIAKLNELMTEQISRINDVTNMKKDNGGRVIARKLQHKPISESGIRIRDEINSVETELKEIKSGNLNSGQKKKIKTSFKKLDLLHNVDRSKIPQNTTIIRGMIDWTERDFSPELVTEINEKIKQVEGESLENKNIIAALKLKIAELEKLLLSKTDKNEVEKLTKTIADLEYQLAMETENRKDNSAIEKLEGEIVTLKTTNDELTDMLNNRPEDNQYENEDNQNENEEINKLKKQVAELQTQLANKSVINQEDLNNLRQHVKELEAALSEATNGANVNNANSKLEEARNAIQQTSLEKVELNKILQKINEQSKRLKTLVKISHFITGFLAEMGEQNPLIKDHDFLRLCQLLERHNRFFDQQEYISQHQARATQYNSGGTTNWSSTVDDSNVAWRYKNVHQPSIRTTNVMKIDGSRLKFKNINLYYNEATNETTN